ncbi:MAG: methylmalonyl-CoA mutase family protein [Candidatus Marinimicrobia bacterium]|nr:methylmalonyl-CoA mutase family protein [Candidatus Neomarinimicrobiota bacterium]
MNNKYNDAKKQWEIEKNKSKKRDYNFDTVSGIPVEELYLPENGSESYLNELGFPGQYPYTRGVHANLYRGKLWTMRQFAGFGSPEETNNRFKFLLEQGQTGLSVAFDMPTLMGYDSDHPVSLGEVGKCGVSISSLKDMEVLFDGIDLSKISVSQTINGPAVILFAFYIAVAEKQGVDIRNLQGTLQNDILKEYIAQKEWIYPPKESMRIITDMIKYCADNIPQYNTISVSGYHIREAGSTAAQELAFTLADGFCYVEHAVEAGLDIDQFAPRLSFFFNSHLDFFEEIAKFRAGRRIWAKLMKEKYSAKNPKSWKLRFHTQTAGFSLTAQQPENNIARTGFQAMAAVLGGTQSLHTNSMDETLALPSEKAAEIALRTQQLIAYETGITNVVDPLGGSWFVESLTDKMENEVMEYFNKIEDLGGVIPAIEMGFFQREIAEASMDYQKKVESKQRIVVGVTDFIKENEEIDIPILEIDPKTELNQVDKLKKLKSERDSVLVNNCLEKIKLTAINGNNLLPPIIEAAKAYATMGEIVDVLKVEFGEWQETAVI